MAFSGLARPLRIREVLVPQMLSSSVMNKREEAARRFFTFGHAVTVAVVMWLAVALLNAPASAPKNVSYSEFMDAARAGKLTEVEIDDRTLTGKLKPEDKSPSSASIRANRIPRADDHDLINTFGKSRTAGRAIGFSNGEREQTLNQLLAEIDGFDSSQGVILMAATNAPEVLDQAFLRAGRFDRQVLVDRPDVKDRLDILHVHAKKIVMADGVNLEAIGARTPGMVGTELANIVNEAALLAVRRGADRVHMQDFEEAADRVMLGLEKKGRVMSAEEKERVAVHESGHGIIALSVKHADPLHRVSIIPRSIGALGYTLRLPANQRSIRVRQMRTVASERKQVFAIWLRGCRPPANQP